MKNGERGSGIQAWSSLPLEMLGDYRELGFVHGANRIQAWTGDDFPAREAEYSYRRGFEFGVTQRDPSSRNYAAGQYGLTCLNSSPEERTKIVRGLLNGEETLAFQAGFDFAQHAYKFPRTIRL